MVDSQVQLAFPSVAGKEVCARFDGGDITSDAGLLLLEQADRKLGLIDAITGALRDRRQRGKVTHPLEELVRERVFAMAAGYPDANDLDTMRDDPALKLACRLRPDPNTRLASQPTLSRLENSVTARDLLAIGSWIAERVVAQLPADTKTVTLDVDATDDPCYGQQEFEFFNRYYDAHCYLPLLLHVTDGNGRQHLLGALLRPGNCGAAKGLFSLVERAVKLLRARFPGIHILLRADSAFGNCAVLNWCDKIRVDFLMGLPTNRRLVTLSTAIQMDACLKYRFAGDGCREFGEFEYKAGTWPKKRRTICKAEITQGKLNPRYVVTSLTDPTPEQVYARYCERGDQENRIKEMKLDLQSGRTSCHRFLANQYRLLLCVAAYALLNTLRSAASETRWANAQVGTLRLRLLKVGARVIETYRKIWLHLPTAFPEQAAWLAIHGQLLESSA